MNLTSMISDLIGEGSFGVSFVARKPWFAGSHKDLPRKNVFSCFLQSNEFLLRSINISSINANPFHNDNW